MKGSEVLKALEEGKKMRIKSWRNDVYFEIKDGQLKSSDAHYTSEIKPFSFIECEWEEYKEPFKIGDWVVFDKLNVICKIIEHDNNINAKWWSTDYKISNANQSFPENELRKATDDEIKQELERREWQKIDREPNEYKVGDIVKDCDSGLLIVSHTKNGQYVNLKTSDDTEAEYEYGININDIKLVCPVENRFDKLK